MTSAGDKKLEQLIMKLRRGPDAHLYTLLGSDHLWNDPGDFEAVCLADLRALARYLCIRIYVWYPAGGGKPDRWMAPGSPGTVNELALYYFPESGPLLGRHQS